jgi:hypothetical protein
MDWPTPAEAAQIARLPATVADDPAFVEALEAAKAEVYRLAPRRFDVDVDGAPVGPFDSDAWFATCTAAALEFRAAGAGTLGYPETGQMTEPVTGDGWQNVRRLLGIGFYARPRIG